MIVSHKHKFIYIKAGKVAGTSTEVLLEKYCGDDDIVTPIRPRVAGHTERNHKEGRFKNHKPAKYILKHLGEEIFNEYHKVMNVRNPWERVVSMYHMRLERNVRVDMSFEDYVKSGTKDLDSLHHYCAISKQSCLDTAIRFENLFEDTANFMKKLSIGNLSSIHSYPQEKGANFSRGHYTEYYNQETKEIIRERYRKDIEFFNYEYDK